MAFSCDENVRSRNGIKIFEEASCGSDLYSYLAQGLAILNRIEISNFREHLKPNINHDTDIIFVEWKVLKRRDITNICRMFANTVSGMSFIPSSIEQGEAIETIQNICAFHGLRGDCDRDDGLFILTDENFSMLKI